MVSKFRNKLNRSYCLVRVKGGWKVAKISQGMVFLTHSDGLIENVCTDDDNTGLFKRFTESLEYEHQGEELFDWGDTVDVENESYYVVDSGFRGDDGKVKYLIAR